MKFAKHFDAFLRDHVNLNQTRLDKLDGHASAIEKYLQGHETFEEVFVGTIPQGSWAHKTIIKPLKGKEFDADFLLEVEPVEGWEPRDYVNRLRQAFLDSEVYKERASLKTRCVRIQYAGDCHADVVPFIRGGEDGLHGNIANRMDNAFETTNPEALTSWFDGQSQTTAGHLRRVTRLVKYLRDVKQTFTAKSVILTTLLASMADRVDADESFTDTPTALVSLLAALADYLEDHPDEPPDVPDPSSPGSNFNHRWPADVAVYKNFRAKMRLYADKVSEAHADPDRVSSMTKWRGVFGDGFGAELRTALVKSEDGEDTRPRAPGEKFIDDPEFGVTVPESLSDSVKVACRVLKKAGFRHGDLGRLGRVAPGRKLCFEVQSCTVPEPYRVLWKVKNAGAAAAGNLRGQIYESSFREEPTKYRGHHWVDCYIVKDGVLRARQRYIVRIR